jgi:zinc finger CCCH domain-containing protein 13
MYGGKSNSPPRYKTVVSNGPRDRPRSPPSYNSARDEPKYLVPARSSGSDHHQRHYSARGADADRLAPAGRSSKRPEYHQAGGYNAGSKGYAGSRGIKDDDFSYTGPREQFARDYPDRGPSSRDPLPRDVPPPREFPLMRERDMPPPRDIPPPRRERPVSVMDPLDLKSASLRRDPLPPSRQPDRLEPVRRSVYDDAPDRSGELPQRRQSMRQPVVHQPHVSQNSRDDGRGPVRELADRTAPRARRERYDDDDPPPKLRQREIEPPHEREQDLRRERDRDRPREREREYVKDRDRDRDPREREYRERDREREREREKDREIEPEYDRERERERDRDKERHRRSEKKDRYSDEDRDQRTNDGSAEHSGASKVAAAGLAGVATAGIANAVMKSKKSDEPSDSDERKERHRRRHHRHKDEDELDREDPDDSADAKHKSPAETEDNHNQQRDSGYGTSRRGDPGDSPDDEHVKRRHRRRHHDREPEDIPAEDGLQPPHHHSERDVSPGDDGAGHYRRREKSRSREVLDPQRTISPGDEDDGRKRRVTLVEPERKEEFKPKGILKPQRMTPFPEDPNPTREGVAPLKESGKQNQPGIPDGARWTKISRMLVNPEALEKYNERFEEREEYVIVLRVLTREEITKFAEKTQQIRGKFDESTS